MHSSDVHTCMYANMREIVLVTWWQSSNVAVAPPGAGGKEGG